MSAVAGSISIPLVNPSFEEPAVATIGASITGWSTSGSNVELIRESYNPTINSTSAGLQFVRFATQQDVDGLIQTVAGHVLAKGLYRLDFSVSDVFNDTASPRPFTVKLLRADTDEVLAVLAIPASSIPNSNNLGDPPTRKSLELYLPEGHPAVGKALTIRFEAGTQGSFGQLGLDDVSLQHDPDAIAPARYTLDASAVEARTDAPLAGMSGVAKDGTRYGVTRNGWSRNDQPWFPISGEFHYLRYPEAEWDRELAKMKAAGVDVVATYVFWNHHETTQGTWDWNGRKNLRRFVELCARHDLKVWLRIGPYVNAEAANGGIPTFANTGKRTDNPTYLGLVDLYFQQIAGQCGDLFVKDGGPIVGIQLENEFASGNPVHITTLKQKAIAKGLVAPYYTVTGNSRFEAGTAIPLQGSYTYRGWENAGGTSPTSGYVYGTDEWTANTDIGGAFYDTLDYPRGYCELGTGSPMRGNDRFLVEPKYVLGQAYDSVGRGSNYLGYYMFHGGTQMSPWGDPSWGSSYDFQAPLGEFGQLRDSGRGYRRLHTFLREFASEFVPTKASREPGQILDASQTSRLRYIGRFHQDRGFLFLNNTQRNVAMPTQQGVQIEITIAGGTLKVPSVPLTMPEGRSNVFPIRMNLAGIDLLWATVQPFAKIENRGEVPAYVFWLPDWTNRELAFPAGTGIAIEQGNAVQTNVDGCMLLHAAPDARFSALLTPAGATSPTARILLITESDSLNGTVTQIEGRERLIVSRNADLSSVSPSLRIEGPAGTTAGAEIFPATGLHAGPGWSVVQSSGSWGNFTSILPVSPATPQLTPVGPGKWTITGDPAQWQNLSHAYVRLNYAGGAARLVSAGIELTRDLYHGDAWLIDLKRYTAEMAAGLQLEISPWDSSIVGVSMPAGPMPSLLSSEWQPRIEIAWNDFNGNGLWDDWEIRYFGNQNQTSGGDPDHDGLDNLKEQSLGTDPTKADSDGDGTSDKAESRLGIDPLNSGVGSRFDLKLERNSPQEINLSWPSGDGCFFRVEGSPNLREWAILTDNWPGSAGICHYMDHPPLDEISLFYRVSLLP